MSDIPELSVVILCYRSGLSIIDFAKKAEEITSRIASSYEIILVGNYLEGSDDDTADIVQRLASENPFYKSVSKPKRGMMGWDMKEGLRLTSGRYICVIDGDGQFPLESIESCFALMKTGKYDLVKTYRKKRNDGFYRNLISKVYNFIFSLLFPGIHSKDTNSKPKIFSRKAYELMDLQSDDWFIDAEIMLKIKEHHLVFHEIPVEFFKLEGRGSFVKFQAILEFIRNLIKFKMQELKRKK